LKRNFYGLRYVLVAIRYCTIAKAKAKPFPYGEGLREVLM